MVQSGQLWRGCALVSSAAWLQVNLIHLPWYKRPSAAGSKSPAGWRPRCKLRKPHSWAAAAAAMAMMAAVPWLAALAAAHETERDFPAAHLLDGCLQLRLLLCIQLLLPLKRTAHRLQLLHNRLKARRWRGLQQRQQGSSSGSSSRAAAAAAAAAGRRQQLGRRFSLGRWGLIHQHVHHTTA